MIVGQSFVHKCHQSISNLLKKAMQESGYNLKVLPSVDKGATEAGLKYVNNDACYPSILVAGQMMEALTSGEYDVNKQP